MTVQYNRFRDDVGKGFQVLRRGRGQVVLANGTVFSVIDQIPARSLIRRILIGSAIATDITGNAEVLALAQGSDLDTAAGAGNRLITPVANFTTKQLLDSSAIAAGSPGALTALAQAELAQETILLLSVAHNAAVVGGDVYAIVEYDVAGTTYGTYDAGGTSLGTYE